MEDKAKRGLRITTWNVNGIRSVVPEAICTLAALARMLDAEYRTGIPLDISHGVKKGHFPYAMFEILQADIVIMQETKIQRKDLRDDMVLVPGWDVFFSLPKHKKGYSGVAVYTRNSVCAPIRAEEGITGVLTPPNSPTSFSDLSEDQQIGGYPSPRQLSECSLDAATLDSEGRCVILEFPAFVLIGTYCPANRDESRDEFRIGFLNALDARVRNLVAAGKRVFLTGDLNIVQRPIDSANAEEQLRKQGITSEEYISTPARRMLNQLLVGGEVVGDRDEGREEPVMWDICRSFHPTRKGMFTCWEQKINARPGNFGSRIDYVLCSQDWKDWFCESDIQEGLMGSDHCPVYAVLMEKVTVDGKEVHIRDMMSSGIFEDGIRQREWCAKDLLPMSARLIPEFDRRRSIRDMFSKRPPLPAAESPAQSMVLRDASQGGGSLPPNGTTMPGEALAKDSASAARISAANDKPREPEYADASMAKEPKTALMPGPAKPVKRPSDSSSSIRPQKRGKTGTSSKTAGGKGQSAKAQSSLMGFFKPKAQQLDSPPGLGSQKNSIHDADSDTASLADNDIPSGSPSPDHSAKQMSSSTDDFNNYPPPKTSDPADPVDVVDPIVAKEGWSKLLGGKRIVPRCEHDEPCISHITRKAGENCGRSFFMCPRPLGPSGKKEKNTEWRCGTFIWSSDWSLKNALDAR
ncbi:DNA lyase [Marssonina coronariae]|uniref:DNA-(apurinic or apyrimidinic site) endonuclease 2 n=1 Tax=Diplocarpon coronariae TaxID=2795749 RepID=A0A218YYT3_9HELO|nr:DNA lyase [Marssonina coronariae]